MVGDRVWIVDGQVFARGADAMLSAVRSEP
jgi:hypothetical protein